MSVHPSGPSSSLDSFIHCALKEWPLLTKEGEKKECLTSNNLIFINRRSFPKMPVGLYSLLLVLMA